MLDVYKQLVRNQYEAALAMLNACIERCPSEAWDAPVVNLRFCQVAFHTLFFTDLYLGLNEDSFRQQAFHRDEAAMFGDYEELEDRLQVNLYARLDVLRYVEHCRAKAKEVVATETTESLASPCGFPRKPFSRAELHVLNVRHIQHHTSQLSLRLRLDWGTEIPWAGSGWREMRR